MEYIVGILALAFSAIFALSAFATSPTWAAKSRLDLVLTGLDAVVVLLAAWLLTPWASIPPLLWLIPVAILAVGVYGCVLRWAELPTLRPDKKRRSVIIFACVHGLILVGFLLLLLA